MGRGGGGTAPQSGDPAWLGEACAERKKPGCSQREGGHSGPSATVFLNIARAAEEMARDVKDEIIDELEDGANV